jgi:hypothetical protein
MTPETRALLAASDHPTACEAPPGWDRASALGRVLALVPELRRIANVELALDDDVQDASFFCNVACYREERPGLSVPVVLVRFSAFGRLVSATWSDDLDAQRGEELIAALRDAGFDHVSADELDEPYTGVNPHVFGQTWWIRFFDYL